jgi:hypothetical protein
VSDFKVYLQWLYTGQVVINDRRGNGDYAETLVQLYIFADYLGDDTFSNAIIDDLVKHSIYSHDRPMKFRRETVNSAWRDTSPDSTLQRLLVELINRGNLGDMCVPEFLDQGSWLKKVSCAVFKALHAYSRQGRANMWVPPTYLVQRCFYHRHIAGQPIEPKCLYAP